MSKNVFLSVGITAHNEGYLAHKTIRCVLAALERVQKKGYSYEVIINLDRGDETTKNYLARYKNKDHFTILPTDFGDLGLSRNNIAKHAKGKYLAFIDADDLVSLNWYVAAIEYQETKKQELILHPCVEFIFGTDLKPVYCEIHESGSKASDAMILAGCNRWTSTVFGLRKTFLEHPYMRTGGGYGYEDYNFNTETIAAGILHMTPPETVMFYRRKKVSLLSVSNDQKVIQPYSKLLDIDYIKSIPEPEGAQQFLIKTKKNTRTYEPTDFSQKLPQGLQKPYLAMRNNRAINKMIIPTARIVKKIIKYEQSSVSTTKRPLFFVYPEFLINSWRDMNQFEPMLYPRQETIKRDLEYYYTDGLNRKVGPAFWVLAKQIKTTPDYIFMVPRIAQGGAEKVIINYLKAIKRIKPEWSVAIITTEKDKNVWADKLPSNAFLIDFGSIAAKLNSSEADFLFSRLITQLRCNRLHLVNSIFAYKWVANHGKLIKTHYHLYVSIFCNDIHIHSDGEEMGGFADPWLLEAYPYVEKIFTDNKATIDDIIKLNGYIEQDKFKVHYQPLEVVIEAPSAKNNRKSPFRVLWASRISPQKQPELLNEISASLEREHPGEFAIDVYGTVDTSVYKKNPINTKQNSLAYKGKFDGFRDLPLDNYSAFLYTSRYDGIPNVILEAAAEGLPIVTSNAGGISEFIDSKTGILIEEMKNPQSYADAIKHIKDNPQQALKLATAALKRVKENHSWEEFISRVAKDICDE